ncbi:MAG: serine hydrolase domain-containing protein [Alsobacter sp.]
MSLQDLAERAFAPVEAAIEAGRIPGAVLALAQGEARAFHHAGLAQREPGPVAMTAGTWFDLASLTKVVFTTTAILRLAEAGQIGLDEPLAEAIPDLRQYDVAGAPERRLTYRQLLSHQTHLPAVEPLYTLGLDPQTLRAHVLQRAWTAGPPVYSDINFILLGIALERLTGVALADQPLPDGFSFQPDPAQCAATERCTWRGRVMRGAVHDENAFALGGAAGHAGLFGTAAALAGFAANLAGGRILGPTMLNALRQPESATRTLGWERPHPGWSGGDTAPAAVIGHTGFTGTGLWIDLDGGPSWALLTNRVYPSRHTDSGIVGLRRAIGAVIAAG